MKYSIGKKLLNSGLTVLVFISLILITTQVVVRLLKDTSTKLVIEYKELDAIQEFKFSLGKLFISTSNYVIYGEKKDETYFKTLLYQAEENLKTCKDIVTESHGLKLLDDFETGISTIDSLAQKMFKLEIPRDNSKMKFLLNQIRIEINKSITNVEHLLDETKTEIDEYVIINNTVIKHSTITFLSLGLLLVIILTLGGIWVIRSLTRPIKELVSTTNKISKGDRSAKVNIKTKDEFHTLAISFNKMVETLDKTSVSKDYLDDILKNMFDALIVTDKNIKIRSVNKATLVLLDYEESELIGQDILFLFENNEKDNPTNYMHGNKLKKYETYITGNNHLRAKSGQIIPVLLSCTILKKQNKEPDGLIVVGHDLTEKNTIEKKLDQTRKERIIDINDAQEEERIRIATDLHDGLGQILTGISYTVQNLIPDEESEESVNEELILRIQQQIDTAIRETKNLAHNLIPIVLKDFGLIVAIENLIKRANETHETKFLFNAYDFHDRINAKLEKAIYRICQESLNNIIKHAQAKNANFQIFRANNMIVLVIDDDGIGFDTQHFESYEAYTGIGLISIRERVVAFDGVFTIDSVPGNGTEIIIEIPCRKN